MRKKYLMTDICSRCVFYRKGCVLGHRRPWNATTCEEFRPYCVACTYPAVFCHTCRNAMSKGLKPSLHDMKPAFRHLSPFRYDCVWQSGVN